MTDEADRAKLGYPDDGEIDDTYSSTWLAPGGGEEAGLR